MDIKFYLQSFEASVSSYVGDDPLDSWEKFVEFLDSRLPVEERNSLVLVLERLIQTFLQDSRYHDDPRFILRCIQCASFYPDPIKLYSFVHGRGVGARAAALYVSWAQQFEHKGLFSQAEQVYQRALENQAEPQDTVLQQYRLFQSRTAKGPAAPADHGRTPLQNSQLVNQNPRPREALQPHCKEPESASFPTDRTIRIISRSENNPKPVGGGVECVSMYCVKELECDGSELSFEELRARRYFNKLQQQELQKKQEEVIWRWEEEEEEVVRMKKLLEELNSKLSAETKQETQELYGAESCSTRVPPDGSTGPARTSAMSESAALSFHDQPQSSFLRRKSESHLLWNSVKVPMSRLSLCVGAGSSLCSAVPDSDSQVQQQPVDQRTASGNQAERLLLRDGQLQAASERDESEHGAADAAADAAHGVSNHSHVTPNTSLGLISATPSRALPSPTVNTREALDVIMDMFQAPTLLQDSLFNTTTRVAENSFEKSCRVNAKPPSSALFRIYQDENGSEEEQVERSRPAARALMEIPVSKPNDTPSGVESLTDESAVWGAQYASITACSNHTRDFALAAHLASTPLYPTAPYTCNTEHNPEGFSEAEENPYQRQPTKLSPILEQSPSEERPLEPVELSLKAQGTIVGEGVSLPQQNQTLSLTHNQTSCNLSRQPLGPLTLHENTAEASRHLGSSTKPSWSIYQSPERTNQTGSNRELHLNSMHSMREPHLDQPNLTGQNIKPIWSVYQSLERIKPPEMGQELHSNNVHLVRETQSEKFNSSLQVSNTRPGWSVYQSPERTNRTGSNTGLLNSSNLPVPLQPGVDVFPGRGEDDLLLPKKSFHCCKQQKQDILQENQVLTQQSCAFLPERSDIQDIPMSLEPALGIGWLKGDGPAQLANYSAEVTVRSPQTNRTDPEPPAVQSISMWSIFQSPEKPSDPHHVPQSPKPMQESDQHPFQTLEQSGILLSKRSFNRRKSEKRVLERSLLSLKQASNPPLDVPMSPEPAPGLNWLCTESPVRVTEPDLDVLMTPQRGSVAPDIPPVPGQLLQSDVPMSPQQILEPDYAPSVLVSDPWDEDLITSLLSSLKTPLSSYPNLSIWNHSLPTITPKMTVPMGESSLRVDFVVGQGAFATVYQATNLTTSNKLILKVQKPANPWEFYINSQLDARIEPRARQLFNQLYSAHLFTNGSILTGELHSGGTLLSVVNLYKTRSEKVMPQPLVLYFSACVLQMVEQLHGAGIVHADIKPDNFLLGERFLKNEDFDAESLDHGLVLIDFGQSIDMTLFPQDTAFTARCMTSGFQCTEMLSGRPWNYQTDYFGVAGTVHCLMFGSYMNVRNEGGVWKTNGVFKRNPHSDLWQEFFHTLLNVPDCKALPCLRNLHERLSAELQNNYSTKLRTLKNRLAVQILEARSVRR